MGIVAADGVVEGPMRIAFVGLGIMGNSMARNLMRAGHSLRVHTRTRSKALDLIDEGAVWADSPAEAAVGVDATITIVGLPADVEQVYFGDTGVLSVAEAGSFVIDMSTSRPDLAVRIHRTARERGVRALDAPVSGGDVGARAGSLAIMVGGDADDFHAMEPVFQAMGNTIVHVGPPGSGQHCKMVNQIAIAGATLGVAEALSYGKRAGLDLATVMSVVGGGAASSFILSHLGPKMAGGDFAPGFMIEHFVKDLTIALDESSALQADLPGLALVRSLYRRLIEHGAGAEGTQALFRLYES